MNESLNSNGSLKRGMDVPSMYVMSCEDSVEQKSKNEKDGLMGKARLGWEMMDRSCERVGWFE